MVADVSMRAAGPLTPQGTKRKFTAGVESVTLRNLQEEQAKKREKSEVFEFPLVRPSLPRSRSWTAVLRTTQSVPMEGQVSSQDDLAIRVVQTMLATCSLDEKEPRPLQVSAQGALFLLQKK